MMQQIDGEKIKRNALKGGDAAKEAFSELWKYFYPRLIQFASSFRKLSVSEYGDHAADILIKAFRKIEGYNPDFALTTWVYKIAENHLNDILRKTKRDSVLSIDDVDSHSLIEDEVTGRDLLDRCKHAISLLKVDDQKIAFLKFYESMSS